LSGLDILKASRQNVALPGVPPTRGDCDGWPSLDGSNARPLYPVTDPQVDRPENVPTPAANLPPLRGGQLQHRLKDGASGNIDDLIAGHPALLDQIQHRQQRLPVLGKERGSFCSLTFLCLRIVWCFFFTPVLPSRFCNPILRIRLNRRSTFNYGWDILERAIILL